MIEIRLTLIVNGYIMGIVNLSCGTQKEETVMKKFTKALLGLGVVLASTTLLTACGNSNSGSSSNGKTTVTIWADDPNFNVPIMKTAVKMYNAEHKNSGVTFKVQTQGDYNTKVQTVLSAGNKKNYPNIIKIEDYGSQKLISSYQNSFLTQNVDLSNFSKYKKSVVNYKGKTYGMPFDSGVSALFYRKDVFAKYGVKAKDLNNITWDQFMKLAEKVHKGSGKSILGTGALVGEDPDLVRQMLQSAGSWYFDDSGKLDVNSTAFKQSLKTVKSLKDNGLVTGYSDFNARNKALYNGNNLAVVEGAWFSASLKADKKSSGKWGIATVPRLTNVKGATNSTNEGGSSWYALNTGNAKADNAAKKFLKTMFDGNSKFYGKVLKEQAAVTTYKPAMSNKEWNTNDTFYNQKVNQYFKQNLNKIPSVSYGIHSSEVENILSGNLNNYYSGKTSLDATIKKIQSSYKSQVGSN